MQDDGAEPLQSRLFILQRCSSGHFHDPLVTKNDDDAHDQEVYLTHSRPELMLPRLKEELLYGAQHVLFVEAEGGRGEKHGEDQDAGNRADAVDDEDEEHDPARGAQLGVTQGQANGHVALQSHGRQSDRRDVSVDEDHHRDDNTQADINRELKEVQDEQNVWHNQHEAVRQQHHSKQNVPSAAVKAFFSEKGDNQKHVDRQENDNQNLNAKDLEAELLLQQTGSQRDVSCHLSA